MVRQSASMSRQSRRTLRRAVQLEADVMSDLWDGAVQLALTNLSPQGAWLDSELPLSVGDKLQLAFTPPGWRDLPLVHTRARVARVSLCRRRQDGDRAGMGLCFDELSPVTRCCLQAALRGLPPPLPARNRSTTIRASVADESTAIRLDDGISYQFLAEAPLLSAARPAEQPRFTARRPRYAVACETTTAITRWLEATHTGANDAGLAITLSGFGSPMTAILDGFAQRAQLLRAAEY
jgi:hypothetical protein